MEEDITSTWEATSNLIAPLLLHLPHCLPMALLLLHSSTASSPVLLLLWLLWHSLSPLPLSIESIAPPPALRFSVYFALLRILYASLPTLRFSICSVAPLSVLFR